MLTAEAAGRGLAATGRRRDAEGTRQELSCERSYDFEVEWPMVDEIALASTYRTTAAIWRMSAEILLNEFETRGEAMPGNVRAIPFYYLCSHALELLLKCALLKRGFQPDRLKRYDCRHDLVELRSLLETKNIPISGSTTNLITALSDQHRRHALRYTALLDDGESTFTPLPANIFQAYDELLMATRVSTYDR